MDAITVRKMGKTASINDVDMTVIPGETLAELNALSGPAVSLVVFLRDTAHGAGIALFMTDDNGRSHGMNALTVSQ
ncbi:gifsy-2 prophage ATP-binding sugar transporter-like protein [Escherichia coli DEC9B]|nr:gifsy-2 prophage ATP-binding sugar transporter-like protein [Escherichia coli DEC9B]